MSEHDETREILKGYVRPLLDRGLEVISVFDEDGRWVLRKRLEVTLRGLYGGEVWIDVTLENTVLRYGVHLEVASLVEKEVEGERVFELGWPGATPEVFCGEVMRLVDEVFEKGVERLLRHVEWLREMRSVM